MKATRTFKTQLLRATEAGYTHVASVKSSYYATVLRILDVLAVEHNEHISFNKRCEKPIAEFKKENPDAKIIYYNEVIS